jgi:hypothetical protein
MVMAALCVLAVLATGGVVAAAALDARPASLAPLEFGVDRSNMGTQWTLARPQEPKVLPFLAADYNKPGNFEARRVAVMDGIARVPARWFRDGFGGSDLSIDLLKLVHARGMKMLAIVGAAASDYPPGAYLDKAHSGCQWGAYPLESGRDLSRRYQGVVDQRLMISGFAMNKIERFQWAFQTRLSVTDSKDSKRFQPDT